MNEIELKIVRDLLISKHLEGDDNVIFMGSVQHFLTCHRVSGQLNLALHQMMRDYATAVLFEDK